MRLDILYVSWLKISTRPEQIYKLSKELNYKTDWFYFKENYGNSIKTIPRFFKLIWLILKTKPKIIHAFNGPDVIIYPILMSKLFGTKLIWDYRATPLNDYKVNHPYNPFIYFLKFTKWIAEKSANKIVTPIKYFSEKYGYELLPQIVDYDKSKIIVPKYIKGKNEKILFFAGTLCDIEGIEELLENFHRYKNKNYSLFVFGDGPLKQKVLDFANKDKRIKYFGWKSKNELFGYLMLANLTILSYKNEYPSTIATHTSLLKLGEYLYFGLPVVCPNFDNFEYLSNYGVDFYNFKFKFGLFDYISKTNIFKRTILPLDLNKKRIIVNYNKTINFLLR